MSTNADKIKELENEIEVLSVTLEMKKTELQRIRELNQQSAPVNANSLSNSEISRFSRQIILPEIGVKGQIKLRNTKVLIVGAGGLGTCQNFPQKTAILINSMNLNHFPFRKEKNIEIRL